MSDILESASMIADAIMAIASLIALWQLVLFKRDAAVRNLRAAKEHSISYCSRYLSAFVPLADKFYDERVAANLPTYDGPIGDFSVSSIPGESRAHAAKRVGLDSWIPALNELHVIASAFVSGVADESLGFTVIGRSYCANVQSLYDIISAMQHDKAHPPYADVVHLYNIWSPRLTRAELEKEREQLMVSMAREHSRISTKIASQRNAKIPPIGCE